MSIKKLISQIASKFSINLEKKSLEKQYQEIKVKLEKKQKKILKKIETENLKGNGLKDLKVEIKIIKAQLKKLDKIMNEKK
ncbi:MAG: hypothetical protein HQL46_12405 [Gammaproteobacteria bacterium]|nr:hypothetical protein [Gammaproteobacteria bacterium]